MQPLGSKVHEGINAVPVRTEEEEGFKCSSMDTKTNSVNLR